MTIYSIYKKNHPVIPKQVVNVVDLRISWCRKGFPRTTIRLTVQKEEKPTRVITRRKRVQQNSFKKEDSRWSILSAD